MLPRSRTLPSRIQDNVTGDVRDASTRTYFEIQSQPKPQEDVEATSVPGFSKLFDDDGHLKRTGTMWTASSHIITAVVGSGVLSLAWAIGQLGWIVGPAVMIMFATIISYTSNLLADCYRTIDGKRNYTYTDAVRANLGERKAKFCGAIQNANLFGIAIGYTIAASISMMAIERSNCFHDNGHQDPCRRSSNIYMIIFGITQIFFCQIPDFHQIWWLSIVAAVMSFTYATVGLGLGIAKVAENHTLKGGLMGISVGAVAKTGVVTGMQKTWGNLQSLGDIAFSYSYSIILIEIQDTLKSPPAESVSMKKASLLSISVTTAFYLLCGCFGYAAFGDDVPSNILTGFGFYNPYWLVDIANLAISIHLVGAYQVFCQPLFAFVEKWSVEKWSKSEFIIHEYSIAIPLTNLVYNVNLFRLIWRTSFVIITTIISMLLPFFSDVVGLIGAFAFWPLTVYFPIEMYIAQKKMKKGTARWMGLQTLNFTCLIVSISAACGSVAGILLDLKSYRPFKPEWLQQFCEELLLKMNEGLYILRQINFNWTIPGKLYEIQVYNIPCN